jgi:voltage-gated potassium channel
MEAHDWRKYRLPVVGTVVVGLYTTLSLTRLGVSGLIWLAAAGPILWLFRVVREVIRLVDGKSTPRRVLALTVLLIALTIVEFAALYNRLRGSFAGMSTRFAPLYFSITTFTTTGFGDIHPVTSEAQILVSGQMILDWIESAVVVGLVLAVILDSLNQRRNRRLTTGP